jgi:hypothetical protein
MMDKIDAAVAKIIEAINTTVAMHGGDAILLAARAMQVQAAARAIIGVIAVIVACLLWWHTAKAISTLVDDDDEGDRFFRHAITFTVFSLFVITTSGLTFMSSTVIATAIDGRFGLALKILEMLK